MAISWDLTQFRRLAFKHLERNLSNYWIELAPIVSLNGNWQTEAADQPKNVLGSLSNNSDLDMDLDLDLDLCLAC